MLKNNSMDILINNYRVFPRLFALFYLYWVGRIIEWGMAMPDLSNSQAGFGAAVITGGAAYFKFYVDSGKQEKK